MNTIGQLFKETRQKKKLSVKDTADQLSITTNFLLALERDDYRALPAEVYLKGFVRRYAQFLNIDEERALALFRRDYRQQKLVAAAPPQPLKKRSFSFTPNILVGTAISLTILVFFVLLFWQYRNYTGKPFLIVTSPTDQSTLYQNYVEVTGQTDIGVRLLINGQEAEVQEKGAFAVAVGLQPGVNHLTIIAYSKAGKETIVKRQVEVVETGT
ncbi:helix-turn-helix domain-containing protein [Patescibacteria group bacterium]|nr:helix-turn-helix domain-containing protein [Patescibacteria group bacterium]